MDALRNSDKQNVKLISFEYYSSANFDNFRSPFSFVQMLSGGMTLGCFSKKARVKKTPA